MGSDLRLPLLSRWLLLDTVDITVDEVRLIATLNASVERLIGLSVLGPRRW